MKNAEKIKERLKAQAKNINKSNRAFNALSAPEKRVFIARDVLAQLKLKKIVAMSGTWVDTFGINNHSYKDDKELKDIYDKMPSCEACALGGMFVCAVRVANNLKVNEVGEEKDDIYIQEGDISNYLGKFFDQNQLKLIETTFENGSGGFDHGEISPEEHEACYNFFNDVSEYMGEVEDLRGGPGLDEVRMRLIMENIIANKGEFKVYKRPQLRHRAVTKGYKRL